MIVHRARCRDKAVQRLEEPREGLGDDKRKKWAEFRRMYRCECSKREARAFQEASVDSMSKGVEKHVARHE